MNKTLQENEGLDGKDPTSRAERRQEHNCCKPSYRLCPANASAFWRRWQLGKGGKNCLVFQLWKPVLFCGFSALAIGLGMVLWSADLSILDARRSPPWFVTSRPSSSRIVTVINISRHYQIFSGSNFSPQLFFWTGRGCEFSTSWKGKWEVEVRRKEEKIAAKFLVAV